METPSLVLDSPSNNSMSELLLDQGESTGSVLGHGPPVGVSPGPYVTPVLPTLAAQLDMASTASSQHHTTPRPLFSTMRKLFSGKVDSYWAIGVPATAPVPRLIVVKAVLWVINTLHDPGSCHSNQLPPVPHMLATYGADAISVRLLMYSWTQPLAPCLPLPTEIGEPYTPPVDKYHIYA